MITGFFGLPGCGKTTMACKIAQKELKKIKNNKSVYKHVYTNFYCKGCEKISYSDLGNYELTDSLIILDELTLDADSRNFKQFDNAHKEFFILHRHYNLDLIYFTQQWDGIDKKIRDLTHSLYYVRSLIPHKVSLSVPIKRVLVINDLTKEIVEGYDFLPFLKSIPKTRFTLLPRYFKYFDSFEKPNRELKQYDTYIYN